MPQSVFEDLKQAAVSTWMSFDDTYGYATSKVNRIKDLENVRDNWGYIITMFDPGNQFRMMGRLKTEDAHHLMLRIMRTQVEAMKGTGAFVDDEDPTDYDALRKDMRD